ncbi:SAM-dependent methyltransferase [Duganella sp. 1224]|uniref:class I SAM-dependent methyltransferase n=1 Tax=Duganella sp. 1224 TaxID=2587052 RepID=UPI0015CE17A7|nr:class I SAM-dependent methyltransferase [Duganella sp. 1224]NYE61086.1 SAM-dependent methyltransferase [Duganella sp. 1224]
MSDNKAGLAEVRSQYEALPYPPRKPSEERQRLLRTWLEDLAMINHYCYAGRQDFRHGFRVLVAGGGTGDASIFLAEQLKDTDAQIVHLDFSGASIAIARERAAIRQLDNITFIRDSLLNLPSLGLGKFDYINCSGVLHHLADPDAGLQALRAVLKEDGALGVMVYATYGRTGVYQMQSLLRLMQQDMHDEADKVAHAKGVLGALPPSNWFKRGEDLHQDHKIGDAGIYDLLLHSQDRAYTVGEVFDWFGQQHGLHLTFSDVQRGRAPYLPHLVASRYKLPGLDAIQAMPMRRQHEIAELLTGEIIMHSFYATASATRTAPYGDASYVPFYYHEPINGDTMAKVFSTNHGKPFVLNHAHSGVSVMVDPGKHGASILRLIDGQRSFGDIFDLMRGFQRAAGQRPLTDAEFFADFRASYEVLNAIERLLLRHRDATPPPAV